MMKQRESLLRVKKLLKGNLSQERKNKSIINDVLNILEEKIGLDNENKLIKFVRFNSVNNEKIINNIIHNAYKDTNKFIQKEYSELFNDETTEKLDLLFFREKLSGYFDMKEIFILNNFIYLENMEISCQELSNEYFLKKRFIDPYMFSLKYFIERIKEHSSDFIKYIKNKTVAIKNIAEYFKLKDEILIEIQYSNKIMSEDLKISEINRIETNKNILTQKKLYRTLFEIHCFERGK